MILAQVHNPSSSLDSAELDAYLSNGWFRMGQTIFTTHILHYNNVFHSAIWLRIPLNRFSESSTFKKLRKLNTTFRTVVQPAVMNPEKELLFEKYKQGISFEASASVENLLFGKNLQPTIYNTYEVALYDEDKLIAVGFFDLGDESAAGISSFYDPDYKKHSLGKYLIYLKIDFCKKSGMQYFYPGYFVPGYPVFDYKLDIAKNALEYYALQSQSWLPIGNFSVAAAPLEEIRTRLSELSEQLEACQILSPLFHYEFYNANLTPEFKGLELFDFPVFLYCFEVVEDQVNPMIVFDPRDQQYHLIRCTSLCKTEFPIVKGENFAAHLLKTRSYLFSTPHAEEMVEQLQVWVEAMKAGFSKEM